MKPKRNEMYRTRDATLVCIYESYNEDHKIKFWAKDLEHREYGYYEGGHIFPPEKGDHPKDIVTECLGHITDIWG